MCAKCGKSLHARGLVDVGASTGGDELARSMAEQPFVFRKQAFCCLDCFFEAYMSKTGLCRYVDSLFTMAVKVARIQQSHQGGGGGSGSKRK